MCLFAGALLLLELHRLLRFLLASLTICLMLLEPNSSLLCLLLPLALHTEEAFWRHGKFVVEGLLGSLLVRMRNRSCGLIHERHGELTCRLLVHHDISTSLVRYKDAVLLSHRLCDDFKLAPIIRNVILVRIPGCTNFLCLEFQVQLVDD